MADNKASFLWAIKQQESGGNYNVVNSSSGALGAYQVMPSNVADWTRQALGHSLTPQQYLASPSAQDAVANTILGGYYEKYGADGAAAMWYSGQPDPNKNFGNPPVRTYVQQVLSRMNTSPPVGGSTSVNGNSGGVAPAGIIGDALSSGLEQGLVTAFSSIANPLLRWTFWLLQTGIGIGAIVLGAFLVAQRSETVRMVEKAIGKTAAPEAAPVIDAAVPAPKPAKTDSTEHRRRMGEAREKSRQQSAEIRQLGKSQEAVTKRRQARAKQILSREDYKQYREDTTGKKS